MKEYITKSKLFKRKVEVVLSAQAQMVLSTTPYTEEEFIEWALTTRKISYGGGNVADFLEKMFMKEVRESQEKG